MDQRFLNLHLLQTVPTSNCNRDNNGLPKSAPYGGVERARWSQQSQRRAARTAFEADSPGDLTRRTAHLAEHIAREVVRDRAENGAGFSDEQRAELDAALAKGVASLTTNRDAAKDTLVWIAEAEIREMVGKASARLEGEAFDPSAVLGTTTASLTVAAFGRFLAAQRDLTVDAAVQTAHAFTTHRQQAFLDYFTAVEDLPELSTHSGAGHLNVGAFTSGVFYRYLNVDRHQLLTNWVGPQTEADGGLARLEALYRALVTALPDGMKNSTAPSGLPALVLVEASDRPLSYAPAFERAVPDTEDGYEAASVQALLDYAERARACDPEAYGERHLAGMRATGGLRLSELYRVCAAWTLGR
jgi:CRISPR system Cascade subunit CasC